MRTPTTAALTASLTLCLAASAARGDTTDPRVLRYGEHLSHECSTCHRRDGVDNGIPSILGMKVEQFQETLRFYQSGARTNPVMVSVARSLDEEQMRALAAYYATLKAPAGKRK